MGRFSAIVFAAVLALSISADANQIRSDGLIFSDGLIGMAGFAASGGSCTDGVDCLCDTISTTSTKVFCEDFENIDYYEGGVGDWSDTDPGPGGLNDRGKGSAWQQRFGAGVEGGLYNYADGVPNIGSRCDYGATAPVPPGSDYAGCSGQREWCSAAQGALTSHGTSDCWGPFPDPDGVFIDIQRSGDYDAEVTDLTLTGGTGETSDVGGGKAHLAQRLDAGAPGGKHGTPYLKLGTNGGTAIDFSNLTEVGLTMKLAYSPNIFTEADTVLDGPWKHDEWGGTTSGGGGIEHWNLGRTGCGDLTEFPYNGFMFATSESACNTALSSATKTVGNADCTDAPALRLCSTSAYDQATHFPGGQWACHQAHIKGLNTSDVDIEIKHNGVTVIKLENFDGAALLNKNYNNFTFNHFANTNDPASGGSVESSETMYRYEDDIVVVNGPPEPCSSIGM